MHLRDRGALFFATGGFIGKIPFAPGTFGSLWGIPICYGLSRIELSGALFCTILFAFVAIWFAGISEKILKVKDASAIVIDEVAGFMVALLGLPFNTFTVVAGFLIFRIFDIVKPFPIRQLERNLPGGAGIVLDDVAAGIYTNFLLRAFLFVFP